jgi:DNA polymerase-4
VEQISIDEAFLDVSALAESGENLARRLQKSIREQLGLPCSLGVATNKLVAKTATDVGKAAARRGEPPNAILVVPPGREQAFLAPLPAEALWGVGPKTAARLAALGIHTIGDLARWPEADLVSRFGKNGSDLARRARGIDDRPIVTQHETKSISQETTFAKDVRDRSILLATLGELSAGVARRLRKENLAGTTVKIKLRWADFTTLTRQVTLPQPTSQEQAIFTAAQQMFATVWQAGLPVRLVGVGVSGLGPPIRQLTLWEIEAEKELSEKERRLQAAIEILRERFGGQAVRRGNPPDGEI